MKNVTPKFVQLLKRKGLCTLSAIGLICSPVLSHAVDIKQLSDIQPSTQNNIEVIPLESTADTSTFIIFVRDNVRKHFHKTHTEVLYVLEGSAVMIVGDTQQEIASGDFLHLPPGTIHGVVEVISKQPLKVLSVQAPEFFGKDRHFVP